MIDYDKLLNSIPEGLNQIEIARFLYIELGKYFIYDPDVIAAQDIETRKKIAYRGIDEMNENKTNINCDTWILGKLYSNL